MEKYNADYGKSKCVQVCVWQQGKGECLLA